MHSNQLLRHVTRLYNFVNLKACCSAIDFLLDGVATELLQRVGLQVMTLLSSLIYIVPLFVPVTSHRAKFNFSVHNGADYASVLCT